MAPPDDPAPRTAAEVVAALQAAIGKGRELGASGLSGLGAGVDDVIRRVVDDRVDPALERVHPPLSPGELTAALAAGGRPSVAKQVGSRSVNRLVRRTGPLRAIGGRTPIGLALRYGPALYDVVGDALRTMDVVATQLASRAADAGVDPDPDRLRAAVVQLLTQRTVDPGGEVDHLALARTWLGRAGSRLMPFGIGGRSDRSAAELARSVQAVDPRSLGSAPRRRDRR